jgi:hypothetical protein
MNDHSRHCDDARHALDEIRVRLHLASLPAPARDALLCLVSRVATSSYQAGRAEPEGTADDGLWPSASQDAPRRAV